MNTHRWTAVVVWVLLGVGTVLRGGFAFAFLFGAFTLLFLYGWLTFWVGLYGVRLERRILGGDGHGTFTVGDEAIVEVSLRRPIPFPVVWMAVCEQIGDAEHSYLCGPWLSERHRYRYVLPLPARGEFAFAPAELWVGDPFGIVQHRLRIKADSAAVFAAPKPRSFDLETERLLLSAADSGASAQARRDGEPGDFRLYRDGDPIQRVVWKLAAKRDEWLIRAPDRRRTSLETVVLADTSNAADRTAVDACASAAAGVIAALGARGRAVRYLDASDPAAETRHWRRRLASLRSGAGLAFAESGGRIVPGEASAIVLILAAPSPEAMLLCRQWAAARRAVVVLYIGPMSEADGHALAAGGVRTVELTADGERQRSEGGGGGGTNRLSFSS